MLLRETEVQGVSVTSPRRCKDTECRYKCGRKQQANQNVLKRQKESHYRPGEAFPLGLQEVEAPKFLDNWHMKVVRLSAVRTGRL
jgi:hypothetical protein